MGEAPRIAAAAAGHETDDRPNDPDISEDVTPPEADGTHAANAEAAEAQAVIRGMREQN